MAISPQMSVEEEEHQAQALLVPQLQEHLGLITGVYNLVSPVSAAFDDQEILSIPVPTRVRLVLLGRLADDLVCVGRLCERGYSSQGCTVATSIFETAHTCSNIGTDDERAQQWVDHNDPKSSFKSVWTLVRENVDAIGVEDADTQFQAEYDVYTQLCWMKHVNPMLQDFNDPHFWEIHGSLKFGPDTSEDGIKRSWFALQHSGRLGLMALEKFRCHDLQGETFEAVTERAAEYGQLERDLHRQARDRWGNERPFEGQW